MRIWNRHRIEVLVEARKAPLSDRLEAELMDEKRDWQQIIQEWFRRRPGEAHASGLAADYEARLANLERAHEKAMTALRESHARQAEEADRAHQAELTSRERKLAVSCP